MANIAVNKIDPVTSIFVEQIIVDEKEFEENQDETLIREEIPSGMYKPKWNGTTWEETKLIEEILELRKKIKEEQLKEQCEQDILKGFRSQTTGYFFAFDNHDQNNFTQQMVMLLNDPAIETVTWKTEDAGTVSLSKIDFISVVKESETHKRYNIGKLWQLRSVLASATTIEELDAIRWSNENIEI